MELEFQDSKNERVVLARITVPDGGPIPSAGDRVDVPDLAQGFNQVHFAKVKSRWFICDQDMKLSKVVVYCDLLQ